MTEASGETMKNHRKKTKAQLIEEVHRLRTALAERVQPAVEGIDNSRHEKNCESERKFRCLAEKSPNMIFINKGGRVVYANPKCEEVMGYSTEEYCSPDFDFFDLIAEESRDKVRFAFAAHQKGKEIAPYEYTLLTKSGKRVEAIITTKLIDFDSGKAILEIITDITSIKKVEEKLRCSEDRYRHCVENPEDGMALVQDGKIVFANAALGRNFGYERSELIGRNFSRLVLPDDRKLVERMFKDKLNGASIPHHFMFTATKKNRSTLYVSASLSKPFIDKGKRTVFVILRDVTDRKRIGEALTEERLKWKNYFDNLPLFAFSTDEEGRINDCNSLMTKILKYRTKKDLVGRYPERVLFAEPSAKRFKALAQQLKKSGGISGQELQVLAKSGEAFDVLLSAYAFSGKKDTSKQALFTLLNITEQKMAQNLLRESEEKYRMLVEKGNDGIAIIQDRRLSYVNPRLAKMLGYQPRDLLGIEVEEFIHPDDFPMTADRYRMRMEGKEVPSIYESRLVHRNGHAVVVEFNANKIAVHDQPAVLVFVRDITEYKKAQRESKRSKRLLEKTFQSLKSAVFILDTAKPPLIVDCNPAACSMFGYSREEMLGKTSEFLHINTKTLQDFQKVLYPSIQKKGFLSYFEFRMKRRSGEIFPTEHFVSPLNDETYRNGLGWVSVIEDITGRKRAEESLKVSEEKYRNIVDMAPNGIAVLDLKGKIETCNDEFLRMVDLPKERVIDRRFTELPGLTKKDTPRLIKIFNSVRKGKVPEPFEADWSPAEGDHRIGEVHVSVMRKNRRISGIQILVKDVTEKKKTEEMIRKKGAQLKMLSEQLINAQEAERIKISRELHDELGQSLTLLRLCLAGIERELPSGNSNGIKTNLAEADALAENLLSQVHELILEMRPSLLDDLGLVPTLRWYVDRFSRNSKINARIKANGFQSRVSPEIETAIYRVVQEALTNVARHSRARNVAIELKKRKSRIEVSIKDDGIGVDRNKMDRCPGKDEGVGLIGMRERVFNLDGNLSINSQPGVGTRLEISLPWRETI